MAGGRDFTGQAAEIHRQQVRFRKAWLVHYVKKMRSNCKMATSGPAWGLGSVVMVTDMASPSGRDHPFPRLARIIDWMDDKHSQAVLSIGVNRPVGALVLLVGADEQVPNTGIMFDNLVAADGEFFDNILPQTKESVANLQEADAGDTPADADPAEPAAAGRQGQQQGRAEVPGADTAPAPRRSTRERKKVVRFE